MIGDPHLDVQCLFFLVSSSHPDGGIKTQSAMKGGQLDTKKLSGGFGGGARLCWFSFFPLDE